MLYIFLFLIELVLLFFVSKLLISTIFKVFFKVTKNKGATISLFSSLFFIGTVIHELSHMLTAIILFVPVGEIYLFPRIREEGIVLGSVEIGKTDPLRKAIIGLSPIIVGAAVIYSAFYFFVLNNYLDGNLNILVKIIAFYLIFAACNTMFSSEKDTEGLLEISVVLIIIALALYFIGFRINFQVSDIIYSFFQNLCIAIIFPLVIDLFLFLVLRVFERR